jgi:hypothetical protein
MKQIKIRPVETFGSCPAGLTLADEFEIDAMRLENPSESRICFLAVCHLPISTWQLQSDMRFFAHASCPGCMIDIDQENRVIFLLGHQEKWKLSQLISEYLRYSKSYGEPESANVLKLEAIELQNQGLFSDAEVIMTAAVNELKGISRQ